MYIHDPNPSRTKEMTPAENTRPIFLIFPVPRFRHVRRRFHFALGENRKNKRRYGQYRDVGLPDRSRKVLHEINVGKMTAIIPTVPCARTRSRAKATRRRKGYSSYNYKYARRLIQFSPSAGDSQADNNHAALSERKNEEPR